MLSKNETEEIKKVTKESQIICRANVLRMRDKNFTAIEIAEALGITPRTVFNIQANYYEGGLNKALYDDPRPGTPAKFDDRIKSQIVALVCSDPPEGFDRWTLDLIVEKAKKTKIVDDISRSTISIILREHDLKPWQQKSWCIPKIDKNYIDKMEDILEVYERDLNTKRPLVCLDEKLIQLTEDIRPGTGISPGKPKRVDYEYARKGTANVFCAVLPKEGV